MKPTSQNIPSHEIPRIAYLMSRFPKLSETFVLYEILTLEELGAHVEIFPLLRERQTVAHPEAERLTRRARFFPFLSLAILRANWHFLAENPLRYLRTWAEVFWQTWGSFNFFFGALGIFPKAVGMARSMQQLGIQHIHAHFANHPAVAAFIASRLTGIPFSFTAHGSDLHVERRMLRRKIEASAFAVAISNFNRQMMLKECGASSADKVVVLHCGIDPRVFQPRRSEGREGPLQILCVASFEEVKGHRYLVEACRELRRRGMNFECRLVGEGPQRKKIEGQIARAGLAEDVHILGGRPRPEVVRLLSESDVFVLASYPTKSGKKEGIPVALMEAMACGLPVVASATGGIPELVEHLETGMLIPPGDVKALADALQALAIRHSLRRKLGMAGLEKVRAEFDQRKNAAHLLKYFLCEGTALSKPAVSRHDRLPLKGLSERLPSATSLRGASAPPPQP